MNHVDPGRRRTSRLRARLTSRGTWLCAAIPLLLGFAGTARAAAPPPTTSYYISGTSAAAVEQTSYDDACAFAKANPGGERLLVLDYGAAEYRNNGGGALDFSPYYLPNATILTALKSASNGANACYTQGVNQIAYGTNNSTLNSSGITAAQATSVGKFQAQRADQLASYIASNGRQFQQDTGVAIDLEPSYSTPALALDLVNGITADGGQVGYDFGSADSCPESAAPASSSCTNGWTISNEVDASYGGNMLPIPEIYYAPNAAQWTVIRQDSTYTNPAYHFAGVTSEQASGVLSPATAFNDLSASNSGLVESSPGIICFGC